MSSSVSELLRPSLSGEKARTAAPYSLQAVFLASFFGGPIASIGMLCVNARRLGRLRADAAWLGLATLTCVGWYGLAHATLLGASLRAPLVGWLGARGESVLLGFVGFGLSAWLHRKEQRSADLFGLPRPSAWKLVLLFVLVGRVSGVLVAEVLR